MKNSSVLILLASILVGCGSQPQSPPSDQQKAAMPPKSVSPAVSRLADAVAADAADAFDRFVKDRGEDKIMALAFVTVDDAVTPYIMGGTQDDFGPIRGTEDSFGAYPPDWSWNDDGHRYRCDPIIREMLRDQPDSFKEHGRDIFEGIVAGLKQFNESGRFKSKLPRERMLLILWIHDPAKHNATQMKAWAKETNPPSVAEWLDANFPF